MKPWCMILFFASFLTYGSLAIAATQIDPPADPTDIEEISPDLQELLDAVERLPDEDAARDDAALDQTAPQKASLIAAAPAAAQTFSSQNQDIGAVGVAG